MKRLPILGTLGSAGSSGTIVPGMTSLPHLKNGMKAARFSRVELRVQAIASREANNQLLRVPWGRFRKAYEEYPRWQALALWGEAVIETAGRRPSSLLATLKKRCPGFVARRLPSQQSEPLALDLLEWVHTNRFGYAKRQGWLDALIFYGVRHPLSRGAWAYWEHCEKRWYRKRPARFPGFELWWRSALQWPLCESANCSAVAAALERYLDWEALTLWLRPLFFGSTGLPLEVLSELKHRCPRISNLNDLAALRGCDTRSSMWHRVVKAGNDRFLAQAGKEGWLSSLLEQVRSHPWHLRLETYGTHWKREWTGRCTLPYPSLRQWKQGAAQYVKSGPVPRFRIRLYPRPSARIS